MTPTSKIVTKTTRHFPVICSAEKPILELSLQMTDAAAKRILFNCCSYRLSTSAV